MKLILPLSVVLTRGRKEDRSFYLNLNIYRNAHYMILNNAKEKYKELVQAAIGNLKLSFPPPYQFSYTIYPGSNRKFDLANPLPIIQKFCDDALIELGVIPDDSFKIIRGIQYSFGAVDKINPHCELHITPWKEME